MLYTCKYLVQVQVQAQVLSRTSTLTFWIIMRNVPDARPSFRHSSELYLLTAVSKQCNTSSNRSSASIIVHFTVASIHHLCTSCCNTKQRTKHPAKHHPKWCTKQRTKRNTKRHTKQYKYVRTKWRTKQRNKFVGTKQQFDNQLDSAYRNCSENNPGYSCSP